MPSFSCRWESRGIPKGEVSNEDHLKAVKSVLSEVYLAQTRIWEMFMINVARIEALVLAEIARDNVVKDDGKSAQEVKIIQDPGYRRFNSGINVKNAARVFKK